MLLLLLFLLLLFLMLLSLLNIFPLMFVYTLYSLFPPKTKSQTIKKVYRQKYNGTIEKIYKQKYKKTLITYSRDIIYSYSSTAYISKPYDYYKYAMD